MLPHFDKFVSPIEGFSTQLQRGSARAFLHLFSCTPSIGDLPARRTHRTFMYPALSGDVRDGF